MEEEKKKSSSCFGTAIKIFIVLVILSMCWSMLEAVL